MCGVGRASKFGVGSESPSLAKVPSSLCTYTQYMRTLQYIRSYRTYTAYVQTVHTHIQYIQCSQHISTNSTYNAAPAGD